MAATGLAGAADGSNYVAALGVATTSCWVAQSVILTHLGTNALASVPAGAGVLPAANGGTGGSTGSPVIVSTMALLQQKSSSTILNEGGSYYLREYAAGYGVGGGNFLYLSSAQCTALGLVPDGGTVIGPNTATLPTVAPSTNCTNGVLYRQFDGKFRGTYFGAKADGTTDDHVAEQAALNAAVARAVITGGIGELAFEAGHAISLGTTGISVQSTGIKISGDAPNAAISCGSSSKCIALNHMRGVLLEGFSIYTYGATNAISLYYGGCWSCTFRDLSFGSNSNTNVAIKGETSDPLGIEANFGSYNVALDNVNIYGASDTGGFGYAYIQQKSSGDSSVHHTGTVINGGHWQHVLNGWAGDYLAYPTQRGTWIEGQCSSYPCTSSSTGAGIYLTNTYSAILTPAEIGGFKGKCISVPSNSGLLGNVVLFSQDQKHSSTASYQPCIDGSDYTNTPSLIAMPCNGVSLGDSGGACLPGWQYVDPTTGRRVTLYHDGTQALLSSVTTPLQLYGNGVGAVIVDQGNLSTNNGNISSSGSVSSGTTISAGTSVGATTSIAAGTSVTAGTFLKGAGAYNNTTTSPGFYAGIVSGTPRWLLANGTAAQNWEIDNSTGELRFILAGTVPFSVSSAGVLKTGGTAAVSCTAGTVSTSTLVVTNGLVTHC